MARFTQNAGGTGSALNYVQVAGGQATVTSAPSSIIDLDITTTGKPVQISVTGEGSNATAGSWVRINLFRDGSAIGNEMQLEASATSENVPYSINFIDDVAAGTYNYSIRATDKSSGNWTFGEVAGPVMNAVELTGFKGDDGADGADGIANLVVPFSVKDSSGDDLLRFEQGGTGVTRIDALQDDLALRSARDIILYPGDDGLGNVYINWGDATISPDATNRVATIADIQLAGTGDITFVDSTISNDTGDDIVIENKNQDGVVQARIVLDQSNQQVLLEAVNENNDWFNDTQWSTAVWSGSTVTITNTTDIITFFNSVPGNITRVSINGGVALDYQGASYGPSDITIDVGGTPLVDQDPLTVTEIRFYYSLSSKIDINTDNGTFDIVSKSMSISIDSSGDLELNARDEDLDIRANDDIRFTSNWNTGAPEAQWRMTNTGRFELPGAGYIENPIDSSGDGNSNDTLVLVPDSDLIFEGGDQYIVIDPTTPNHIHIRAGGTPDASSAELFLGGESNKVQISDEYSQVQISAKQGATTNEYQNLNTEISTQFIISSDTPVDYGYVVNVNGTPYVVDSVNDDTPEVGLRTITANGAQFDPNGWYEFTYQPDGTHNWTFGSNGLLTGPAQGFINVTGFVTPESYDLALNASASVVLNGNNGEFLNDPNVADNQIATLGDISDTFSGEVSFTVNGGTTATQPTFNGAPLFSGTYVKTGPLVHFQIQVDMDNITNFGTGQYYVDLPFDAKYGYQFKEGCLHDISASNQYAIGGHVAAGTNRLFLTYTGSNGQDELFDHDSPTSLNAADNFHISGTYISQ